MKEKLKKCPWKVIVSVAVFVVTLALNIWLLCMPVVKFGTYKGKSDHWSIEISFSKNTFFIVEKPKGNNADTTISRVRYGLYYIDGDYVKMDGATGMLGTTEDLDAMDSFGKEDYKTYAKPQNVFTIPESRYYSATVWTGGYESMNCVNYEAVFLQVFFAIVYLISVIAIIKMIVTRVRTKRSEKLQNTDVNKKEVD